MDYNIPIDKKKYNRAVLKTVNCFLDMTEAELDIISIMLDNEVKVLDTDSRNLIRTITGKSIASSNNYIKRLKDKQVLTKTHEGLVISESIMRPVIDGEVNIKFNVT